MPPPAPTQRGQWGPAVGRRGWPAVPKSRCLLSQHPAVRPRLGGCVLPGELQAGVLLSLLSESRDTYCGTTKPAFQGASRLSPATYPGVCTRVESPFMPSRGSETRGGPSQGHTRRFAFTFCFAFGKRLSTEWNCVSQSGSQVLRHPRPRVCLL